MDYEAKARELYSQIEDEWVKPIGGNVAINAHQIQTAISTALSQASEEEREACAKIADEQADRYHALRTYSSEEDVCETIASAIRARDNLCQASSGASGEDSSPATQAFQADAEDLARQRQMLLRKWEADKRQSQIEERGTRDDATASQTKPA